MAFKMKSPFMAKTPAQQKLGRKVKQQSRLKRASIPTTKPTKITKKISKKYGLDDPRPRPPQPPKPGTVKGLTQFQYDMKKHKVGNKYTGKLRGKVRDKIKDYFFTK